MVDTLGALPDIGEAEARHFYDRAIAEAVSIQVSGFYGAIEHGEVDSATIFLYRDDPHRPVGALTMARADWVRFADALSALVERFR